MSTNNIVEIIMIFAEARKSKFLLLRELGQLRSSKNQFRILKCTCVFHSRESVSIYSGFILFLDGELEASEGH